ncbi:MAG: fibronectin type III domain-containing protein, partial [Spirochaetales bacterium]|nr:fibronectin type III domain-containing protein [Spirochaetales bacterium]
TNLKIKNTSESDTSYTIKLTPLAACNGSVTINSYVVDVNDAIETVVKYNIGLAAKTDSLDLALSNEEAVSGERDITLKLDSAPEAGTTVKVVCNGAEIASKVVTGEGGTTLVLSGLTPDTTYSNVIVYTLNADKTAYGKIEIPSVSTAADTTPPAAPTNLTVVGESTDTTINISWTNPADEDFAKVKVYYKKLTDSDDKWTEYVFAPELTSTTTSATLTFESTSGGETYNITVSSLDQAGNESAKSASVTAQLTGDTTAPGEVTAPVLNFEDKTLTWKDPSDADLDKILIYKNSDANATEVAAGIKTLNISDWSSVTSVTIKTQDKIGNESTGITLTVPANATVSNLTTQYTGQIVADVSVAGKVEGCTYTIVLSADNKTASLTLTGTTSEGKVSLGGLTVGTEVTPSYITRVSTAVGTVIFAQETLSSITPVEKVVKVQNHGNNKNTYLQHGIKESGTNGTFWKTIASDSYEPTAYWYVYPGAASGCSADSFSLMSYTTKQYIKHDTTTYSKDEGPSSTIGSPVGGFTDGANNNCCATLTSEASEAVTFDIVAAPLTSAEKGYFGAKEYGSEGNYLIDFWNIGVIREIDGGLSGSNTQWGTLKFEEQTIQAIVSVTDVASSGTTNLKTTLTWNEDALDSISTFKNVVITADNADRSGNTISVTVAKDTKKATIENLLGNTKYTFTVTAYDIFGNSAAATGLAVTTTPDPVTPEVSDVAAEATHTGAITVTWKDPVTDASSYTYKVTETSSGTSKTVEAGVQKALFTGLTIGTSYTFKVEVLDSSSVVVSTNNLTATCTAAKVMWSIANKYTSDDPGVYTVYATDSDLDIRSTKDPTTNNTWIVHTSLADSTNPDQFSLEAVDSFYGAPSGKYMYCDFDKTNTTNGIPSSGGQGDRPHMWIGTLTKNGDSISIENGNGTAVTDGTWASFYWNNYGATDTVSSSLPNYPEGASYSNFALLNSVYTGSDGNTTYSMYDTWNKDSMNVISDNSAPEANFAYWERSFETDYATTAPGAVTSLTASAAETKVTVTWTNPSDVDFKNVVLSYKVSGTNDDPTEVTLTGEKYEFTGTAGATYAITVKAVDYAGNVSTEANTDVTIEALSENAPQNATAAARWTGEILVTWEKGALTDATYNVTCTSNSDITPAQTITDPTVENGYVAQFTGLTAGTEYSFKVTATADSQTYDAFTVKATAVEVKKSIYSHSLASEVDNKYLNTNGAGDSLLAKKSTNAGLANWIIYPATDGSIYTQHSVTTESDTITDYYDTFSLYHYAEGSGKGYLQLGSSVTSSIDTLASSGNVSFDTSSSDNAAVFFFGYYGTEGYNTLRVANIGNVLLYCVNADAVDFYKTNEVSILDGDIKYGWALSNSL